MYICQFGFSNSLCKVQIFKKYLAYFSNMRNMTQNIQNGSFDIKTGSRILRIINAAKRASPPSISSYKRGAHVGAAPPLTCMLKMLFMYFILNFLTLCWFFDKCQNNYFVKKSISNYMLNLIA